MNPFTSPPSILPYFHLLSPMTMILHPHASYHNLAQSQMVKKNGLSNESWINRIVDKGKQYLVMAGDLKKIVGYPVMNYPRWRLSSSVATVN